MVGVCGIFEKIRHFRRNNRLTRRRIRRSEPLVAVHFHIYNRFLVRVFHTFFLSLQRFGEFVGKGGADERDLLEVLVIRADNIVDITLDHARGKNVAHRV